MSKERNLLLSLMALRSALSLWKEPEAKQVAVVADTMIDILGQHVAETAITPSKGHKQKAPKKKS